MGRRLVVRVGFSLIICALVGLVLMLSADAVRWTGRDVKVVTTSARTVDGRLRSASAEGLELVVDDRLIAIPWHTVVFLSFHS
jgi:hypothetical protein